MFGKSTDVAKPEWTVGSHYLYNNKVNISYKLSNTHSCFNEDRQQMSVWHLGQFLVTIPISTKVYNKTFIFFPKCDYFVTGYDYNFEGLDTEGNRWVLREDHLVSVDGSAFNMFGLRFVKSNNGTDVYFYGTKQFALVNADIQQLNKAKLSIIEMKHARFTEKQLNELEDFSKIEMRKGKVNSNQSFLLANMMVTTESIADERIDKRLDIVSAEIVLGMNIFKDVFAALSDFFGGRNDSIQNSLREAKTHVIKELKLEAIRIGADAVVAVDLDYSEISGGGKSMLFLVANGTAVTLRK